MRQCAWVLPSGRAPEMSMSDAWEDKGRIHVLAARQAPRDDSTHVILRIRKIIPQHSKTWRQGKSKDRGIIIAELDSLGFG